MIYRAQAALALGDPLFIILQGSFHTLEALQSTRCFAETHRMRPSSPRLRTHELTRSHDMKDTLFNLDMRKTPAQS